MLVKPATWQKVSLAVGVALSPETTQKKRPRDDSGHGVMIMHQRIAGTVAVPG